MPRQDLTSLNFYSSGSSPEDDTPHIPVDQNFMVPKKENSMVSDNGQWKCSQVLHTYDVSIGSILNPYRGFVLGFVLGFYVFMFSFQTIEKLLALLETLDHWIDETPPADQLSRLGNKAYSAWYTKLDQVSAHTHGHRHTHPCTHREIKIK
uniref:Serine/threonine-protein phosphatase 2A activator n=1 Tax=Hucho hucho TaxID=62062 RepID=A0A4W5NJQ4_9TELE